MYSSSWTRLSEKSDEHEVMDNEMTYYFFAFSEAWNKGNTTLQQQAMLVPMQIPTHFHKNQEVLGMPLKT